MKTLKSITAIAMAAAFLAAPFAGLAADQKTQDNPKPYPLETCAVTGEKLGGDMGKPYVFEYKGQEIKLCCKDCKAKFDKDPAKYVKKMEEDAAKLKKK